MAAEQEKKPEIEIEKKSKSIGKGKKPREFKEKELEIDSSSLIRILGTDIPGEMNVYTGLTRIKGISWSFSNAVCNMLALNKMKKISTLSQKEIDDIISLIKKPNFPIWMMNRRKDLETGDNKHLITTDLDLQKEFDIRRLKNLKTYRGWRHALGQPVRGQRTRSHFRTGRAVGVQKTKAVKAALAEKEEKK
ncbi:30S ribosomal protein S13 [Candidatus Pacearchaeota archaeon CG06_land_8_20_14_3_00_35_12]|nr:MAG: 30S ribosomal protein S13 [Candidatus Pacearchaeota archaeon CG06_land_8_20_14_3_00_35_12]